MTPLFVHGALSGVGATSIGTAAVSSLTSIEDAIANAAGTVTIYSGGDADAEATSTGGEVNVLALEDLRGTYTAADNVWVTAYGSISDLEKNKGVKYRIGCMGCLMLPREFSFASIC